MLVKIGGRNQEAARRDLLDEDQKAVDDAAQFIVFAGLVAGTGEGIELVEKQDAGLAAGELEGLADVAGGFPEVGGNQTVETDVEEGQAELGGKDLGAQGLARARRATEEQF